MSGHLVKHYATRNFSVQVMWIRSRSHYSVVVTAKNRRCQTILAARSGARRLDAAGAAIRAARSELWALKGIKLRYPGERGPARRAAR